MGDWLVKYIFLCVYVYPSNINLGMWVLANPGNKLSNISNIHDTDTWQKVSIKGYFIMC